MRIIKLVIFISLICLFSSCNNNRINENEPLNIIFDTDIGNDIDDVLALQMLFNYEKKDIVDILCVTISKNNPYAIEYLDGYCRLNDRDNMPVGFAYDGVNPEDHKYLRPTLDTIIDGKKILEPKRTIDNGIPEGYKLIREVLAQQEDKSVVFIAVGPETNLSRLLDSEPDEFSELGGRELVEQKVKFLSVMGGLYGNEFDFPEWNIIQDLEASQNVFENWPTEIVASGWELGNKLLYPHQNILNDFESDHPLSVSYKIYDNMPYDRQTWDLTSVLYAIEPDSNFFNLSDRGVIRIDEEGHSLFVPSQQGRHQYLTINENQIERTLDAIVKQTANKR